MFRFQANQKNAGDKYSASKLPSHWASSSFNPLDKEIVTFPFKTLLKGQV
jgi:hypothetical protein